MKLLLENVKFEHTIFALPFAYLGMVLAAGGWPTWHQFIWITVAMAAARTMAMSLNRVIDRELDARNPRTAIRPIPSGRLSASNVWLAAAASAVILTFAAWQLNDLAVKLLPVAIVILTVYHYTKRFTWLCHLVLGVADGGAPLGGWLAVTGSIDPPAWLLFLAVTTWVGGFDLIYACQDVDFDRANGLHSVPVRFGIRTSLWAARIAHVITMLALGAVGTMLHLGPLYWAGWLAALALLAYEHSLVHPHDLSRLNVAFFNVNGYIGVIVFGFTLAALLIQ
ncbi:MAG: UbiA-like polyprenyltransferase [Chloroflexota bacterium]